MDNKSLVEKVYDFQREIKNKNNALASSVSNAFLPLLEYKRYLGVASKKDLLNIKGIGPNSVDYFLRIFKGEDIGSIIKDVPSVNRDSPTTRIYTVHEPIETKSFDDYSDNTWDNVVKAYEMDYGSF